MVSVRSLAKRATADEIKNKVEITERKNSLIKSMFSLDMSRKLKFFPNVTFEANKVKRHTDAVM
ncbi:hypothetical protein GCM10007924_28550 [Sneathiella chinensis]|uniref:Uncharacterized protein n=1 Tax=Sneathiella chinensis TaxID=349750 RepID=A0ABQ5U6U5_9PROT|nr:hypothetical protein GCM10007924_28550 [Sneathiella chinensis]